MLAQRRFSQSCAVGLETPASRARRAVGTPSSRAAAIRRAQLQPRLLELGLGAVKALGRRLHVSEQGHPREFA
jgi:hypothetical protein